MDRTRQVARAGARRALMRDWLGLLGPALTWSLLGGLMLVVLERVLGIGVRADVVLGAAVIGAIAATLTVALHRRRTEVQAAVEIDAALGLRDRLSSGLELEASDEDPAFAAVARRDAEAHAQRVKLRTAMPMRLNSWWAAWPVVAACAIAAAALLPAAHLLTRGRDAREAALVEQAAERGEAASQLASAREALAETITPEAQDGLAPDDLRALEEIERELTEGRLDADEARSRAAAELEDLASRFDAQAEQVERDMDALREKLATELERPEDPRAAAELVDALRRGRFDEAARSLDAMREALERGELSEEDRSRLAEQIRRTAAQLGEAADAEQQRPDAGETLRDQGLDEETAQELSELTDEEAIREALREEGLDEPTADRLAERIAEENRAAEAERAAQERARELSESLQEAADELERPEPTPEQTGEDEPPREQGETPQNQQGQSPQEQREDSSSQRGKQEQSGERGEQQQGEGGESQQAQDAQQREEQQQGRESQQGQESEQQQGEQQEGAGGASGRQQREQQQEGEGQASGGEQEGQQREGAAPREGEGEGESSQEQDAQGGKPSDAPTSGEGSKTGGGAGRQERGIERVRRQLEEMAQERDRAGEHRRQAEGVREQSRELLDQMSDRERAEAEQWARARAREQGAGDFETDIVDARRGAAQDGRVAAEWTDPSGAGRVDPQAPQAPLTDRLRDAERGADRAIEEQRVPRRHRDLVRRYFERIAEETARPDAPAPPPSDAPETDGGESE